MEKRTIRIKLSDSDFRKYKVYCAISDRSMTDQTNRLIKDFLSKCESDIKIVKVDQER